jgi:hypothetical protein
MTVLVRCGAERRGEPLSYRVINKVLLSHSLDTEYAVLCRPDGLLQVQRPGLLGLGPAWSRVTDCE